MTFDTNRAFSIKRNLQSKIKGTAYRQQFRKLKAYRNRLKATNLVYGNSTKVMAWPLLLLAPRRERKRGRLGLLVPAKPASLLKPADRQRATTLRLPYVCLCVYGRLYPRSTLYVNITLVNYNYEMYCSS